VPRPLAVHSALAAGIVLAAGRDPQLAASHHHHHRHCLSLTVVSAAKATATRHHATTTTAAATAAAPAQAAAGKVAVQSVASCNTHQARCCLATVDGVLAARSVPLAVISDAMHLSSFLSVQIRCLVAAEVAVAGTSS
jgi:hypothetical protein